MAFFSLAGGAPEVYLPFEEFGQLACRVRAKGAAAAVESKTPNQVQLGLVASGIYCQSIHHTDPVMNPASVVGCELKKYSAASAVISLRDKYKKEDLDRDSYRRFDHASAKGPLAAVFHILAQTEGRVTLLVPDSLLFKPGAERSLREYLLTRQRVEAVVSLPPGSAQGLKGACSILILNTVLASEQVLFVRVTNELLTNADTQTLKFRQVGALIRDRAEGGFSSLVNADMSQVGRRHIVRSRLNSPQSASILKSSGRASTIWGSRVSRLKRCKPRIFPPLASSGTLRSSQSMIWMDPIRSTIF
jgi:type I restriction enzyme M protein